MHSRAGQNKETCKAIENAKTIGDRMAADGETVPLPRSNSFVPSERRLSLVTNLSNRQPMFARCHRLSLIFTDSIQDPVIIAFLIRVSSVSHPWLKRIGKTEPRIYTDNHGFEPSTKHQAPSTKHPSSLLSLSVFHRCRIRG
jgi:hypothetical protein